MGGCDNCGVLKGNERHSSASEAARTLANLDKADDDDERKCQELCRCKEVLYSGGRLHTVAVHKRQQDCRDTEREQQRGAVSGGNLMSSFLSSVICSFRDDKFLRD